jgi:hypothetical protein
MQSLWFPFSGGCIEAPSEKGAALTEERQCCAAYPVLTILHGPGSIAVRVDWLETSPANYFL